MRFRSLFRRPQADRELDEEIRYHLDREIERHVAAGMSRREARHAALREFGGVAQIEEECREAGSARWLEILAQDLRYGVRLMGRSPGFAAAAALTIALGIGAATAIFSLVYSVVLRPLPYRDPARLVSIWTVAPRDNMPRTFVSAADFRDWKAQSRALEDIALVRHIANYNLTGEGEPERLVGARVTANLFDVLGVQPAAGRIFTAEAERQEAAAYVVLLSDRLWRRRFAADPAIVGRTIRLNGYPYTVLGIMPPQFRYPTGEFDLWAPLYLPAFELRQRGPYNYLAVGRLKAGVALAHAQTELRAIGDRLAAAHLENRNTWPAAESLLDDTVGNVRTTLYALLGAVGCLLLIGAVNVASLFLAKGLSRARDRALRSALGASRGRLAAQALLEVLPVVAAGALCGVAAAVACFRGLVAMLPAGMPRLEEARISGPVLGFSAALLLLTSALVAVWPALQAAGRRIASASVRECLVVAEVGLTVMLVAGSCLLARSFVNIRGVNVGFESSRALAVHLAIPRTKYPNDRDVAAYMSRILDRVRAVPGVAAAGMVNRLPIIGGPQNGPIQFEGVEGPAGRLATANWRTVTPDYFRAMGIPLVDGRAFTDFDGEGSRPVGIVDAETARKVYPGQSAIGKRFRIPFGDMPWVEIVGVVGTIRNDGADADARPQIYWNYWQRAQDRMALVVRTAGSPSPWMAQTIAAIRAVDPEQPVYNSFTMDEVLDQSLSQRRLNALLVGVFAAVSLLLAAVGIYGVMSYAVEQRTREFGIRLAIGASAADVIGRVVRRGAAIGLLGSALGLAGVSALARFLTTLLYQVSATDWVSYALAAGALVVVAMAASYVPVRRAVAQAPMKSLRAG